MARLCAGGRAGLTGGRRREADQLEKSRIQALELRIKADLGCGRQDEVAPELSRLVADHPLREGLWGLLMRALYGAGSQAEALETYARAREASAGELAWTPASACNSSTRTYLTRMPSTRPLA